MTRSIVGSKHKERKHVKKSEAIAELLRSRTFLLVTPRKTILHGEISDDFEGFMQIHSLTMVQTAVAKVIKDWENKHAGNPRRGAKSRPNKQAKAR